MKAKRLISPHEYLSRYLLVMADYWIFIEFLCVYEVSFSISC